MTIEHTILKMPLRTTNQLWAFNTAFSQHQQDWEVSRPRPLVAKNQGLQFPWEVQKDCSFSHYKKQNNCDDFRVYHRFCHSFIFICDVYKYNFVKVCSGKKPSIGHWWSALFANLDFHFTTKQIVGWNSYFFSLESIAQNFSSEYATYRNYWNSMQW